MEGIAIATTSSRGNWSSWPIHLGCPVWTCKEWAGIVYPNRTMATERLTWYARTFNAVEGNSTFYGMPSLATFERWARAVPEGFAFCFKFPQRITHEAALDLRVCKPILEAFLERLQILKHHGVLGSTFLQLGPSFSGQYQSRLELFLMQLDSAMPWAVEVRHADWFDEGRYEDWLDAFLQERHIDRVLFDSSPLYSLPPRDAIEAESQKRKPRSPFRTTVTSKAPFVRLIGRNNFEEVASYWDAWSQRIAGWIVDGLCPTVFLHAPDDAYAPRLTQEMHARVRQLLQAMNARDRIPPLPTLLENQSFLEQKVEKPAGDRQLRLFES